MTAKPQALCCRSGTGTGKSAWGTSTGRTCGRSRQVYGKTPSEHWGRAERAPTRDAMGVSFIWIPVLLGTYFLGTLPSAQLVASRRGLDPTKAGSGNPGATNVYRVVGRRAGLVVFLADSGKGSAAALLGSLVDGRALGVACWAAATVGHVLPLQRRFRGGKGVATAGGGLWVLFPVVALCCSVLFALVARLTGKVSLGSLGICLVLPALLAVLGGSLGEVLTSVGLSGMVVFRHRGNIRRLFVGSEGSWRPGV